VKERTIMAKALLPQAFWFRLAVSSPRVEEMPRTEGSGRLLDLPASCALPDAAGLEGRVSWTEVRLGWNARGLGIAVQVEGIADVQLEGDRPEGFADVQIWVDTRDTRDVSRATRFCHRFVAQLKLHEPGRTLDVELTQRPIARAVADSPMSRPGLIASRAELGRTGWLLEVFIPAQVLHGFDPETNRRLGFAYQVADHVREDQFLGVGRDFPIGENPSLWATLELRD
jgi:hypothetical protein